MLYICLNYLFFCIDIRWEIHFTFNPVCNNRNVFTQLSNQTSSLVFITHSSATSPFTLFSRSFSTFLSLFFLKATLVRFYSFHFSYFTHHTFPQMYSDHSELNWYLRIGLLGFRMLHFRSLVYITLTNKTVLRLILIDLSTTTTVVLKILFYYN